MDDKILRIDDLKKYFPLRNGLLVKAVDGVSLSLDAGETLGLVGESGSGKSTIAYVLIGMYEATDGRIIYKGEEISRGGLRRTLKQKSEMQIVFQDPGSSLNPKRTIRQSLAVPLTVHSGNSKKMSKKILGEKIGKLLAEVELPPDFADKYPSALGGGERQLVSVARALAANPSLIILDEPTSALDVSIQAKVISKLIDLQREKSLSYLFITHDLSLMRNVADRVAILYLGRLCEQAPAREFFRNPLHPYTQMLLSSIPVVTEEDEKMKPARIRSSGEIPSPVNVPPGCAFHQRCRNKMPVCETERPSMKTVTEGHEVCCHLDFGR